MKTVTDFKKQGRRNRQRGMELQRSAVKMARTLSLEAHNRDRGGAQHEKGDIEVENQYYGCKRRRKLPRYIYPEKDEIGVVVKGDRKQPLIVMDLEAYFVLLSLAKKEMES